MHVPIVSMFTILVLTLPALILLRAVMAWRINRLMLRKSEEAAGERLPLEAAEEVPADSTPRLERYDADSVPERMDSARTEAAKKAASTFRRWWIVDAGAGVAYALAGLLLDARLPEDDNGGEIVMALALIWFTVATLRYVFYARQYTKVRGRRRLARVRDVIRTTLLAPSALFLSPRIAWYPFLLFVASFSFLAIWAFSRSMAGAIAIGASVLLHVGFRYLLHRQAQGDRNRRLLMLRVFGMNETAFLTFGHVLEYWRWFGTSFTIVDPSYLRFRHRSLSSRQIALVFWLTALGVAGVESYTAAEIAKETGVTMAEAQEGIEGTPHLKWVELSVSAVIIIGYLVFMVVVLWRAPRFFVTGSADASARLTSRLAKPRRWDLSFRDLHLYCFANTWKLAVAAFVDSADVVMMDLRGYSEERKGCEYEVDFLFSSIAIDRIVFVLDEKTELDQIERLIRARWEHLREGSPNLSVTEPTARVYVAGDQRPDDVRGLMNLLFTGTARAQV